MMELQLGLALRVLDDHTRDFDLNRNGCDGNALFGSELRSCVSVVSISHAKQKRGFEEAFGKNKHSSKELPLLLWSGHPNEEDDDQEDNNKSNSCAILINAGEEDKVMGWPPIKLWRKKHFHRLQGLGSDQTHHHYRIAENDDGGMGFNPMYVKVKMEGFPIGRKIDVGLYHSYQTLKTALINMFTDSYYQNCGNSDAGFTLTYQDKEGDWLLAGDLPWQTFLESVQCMKILKRRPSN